MAANVLAPNGFNGSRQYAGGTPNYDTREARIVWNYASKIAFGDPVFLANDGTLNLFVKGGALIYGIFRGCRYLDPTWGRTIFSPMWNAPTLVSTTTVYADVEVNPMMTFQAQMRGTAFATTVVGQNVDIFTGTSGVPTLAGMSTCALDATAAATATLPWRILRIIPAPAFNSTYSELNDNQWLEVMMNTPQTAGGGPALGHA